MGLGSGDQGDSTLAEKMANSVQHKAPPAKVDLSPVLAAGSTEHLGAVEPYARETYACCVAARGAVVCAADAGLISRL